MQYIQTKFLRATNNAGSRIKATTSYGKISIICPFDYSVDVEQAHAKVAMQLASKLNWAGEYICGGSDSGYVFVLKTISNVYECQFNHQEVIA
jgi:hypothetical protein